jgi:DNA polymerase-3 subunit delta
MQGQITPRAAEMLAALVGSETRVLDHELAKLLAYVNYTRPVEADDVQNLTPSVAKVGDFALLNALRERDTRLAMHLLHREMAEKDALMLFASIVHQVRQLLLAREVYEEGGGEEEAARQLHIHPYAARLALEHSRQFTLPELEELYHRLLDLDEAMKTGGMEGDLALDMLVMEMTA